MRFFDEDGSVTELIGLAVELALSIDGQVEVRLQAEDSDLADADCAQLEDGVRMEGLTDSQNE